MRRCLQSICLSALCGMLWLTAVDAQERKGSITGSVTDSAKAILQGARLELQPLRITAVSDNTGQFSMTDLPPGSYTLKISFVGMAGFSKNVTVTAGQVTRVDAAMEVASQTDSITVTAAPVHGEAEAINRERTAENILQVMPDDIITSLPNANVADAIGRLPASASSATRARENTFKFAGRSLTTTT